MRVMLSFQIGSEVLSYSVLQCQVIASYCSLVYQWKDCQITAKVEACTLEITIMNSQATVVVNLLPDPMAP